MTYRVKVYISKTKANVLDDFPVAKKFLERKILETSGKKVEIVFDIENTTVKLPDATKTLLRPLQAPYSVGMYVFDRYDYNVPNSQAFIVSSDITGITLSTSDHDDRVGGTWMQICHELMHTFFIKLNMKRVALRDPMDTMLVNGVWQPYYKNWEPNAKDGNFAEAFKLLAPHWDKFETTPTVTIKRKPSTTKETLGTLTATAGGATFTCHTLELPWKNNQRNVSCIPTGTYKVQWSFSPSRMKYTYRVQDVPNRSGILFHSGNYYKDIQGCILLGATLADMNKDGELDVTSSKVTIEAFERFMGKNSFTLVIQ